MSGLGKAKKIVLFDTLLSSLTPDEACAVLGHELGHWISRHAIKRMGLLWTAQIILIFLLTSCSTPVLAKAFMHKAHKLLQSMLFVSEYACNPIFSTPDIERFKEARTGSGSFCCQTFRRPSDDPSAFKDFYQQPWMASFAPSI